jgi:hypothetical protein
MTWTRRHLPVAAWAAMLLCLGIAARADAPATTQEDRSSDFLRFVDDGKGGGTLQTSITDYQNAGGVVVHLVAAVHVAEPGYYQGLNRQFQSYDALLYELVSPRGAGAPDPGEPPVSAISMFQHWLKDALSLDFQLDDVDYKADNFVHADLDYETFEAMQSQRGESMLGIMLQQMLHQMAAQDTTNKNQDFGLIDLVILLRSPDRPRQLKLLIAQQFGDIEDQMSGLTGPNGSVIITERNKKALAVLQDTIDAGKKNVGIFFGAAHMPDMSRRLEAMGFKPTGKVTWRVAWDMTAPPATTQPTTAPASAVGK